MNDKHTDLSELIELYVLGGLSSSETAELEEHLKQCPLCSEQVSELRNMTGLPPLAAEPVSPQDGMKDRALGRIPDLSGSLDAAAAVAGEEIVKPVEPSVLASTDELIRSINMSESIKQNEIMQPSSLTTLQEQLVKEENPDGFLRPTRGSRQSSSRSRPGLRWRVLSAGLAAAIAVLGIYTVQLNRKVNDLQFKADRTTAVEQQLLAASLKPAQGLRIEEAVKLDPVSQDIIAQGLATIVIDSQGTHLVVQAEKLPQLQNNEAYQVWLIHGDVKHNAGTFLSRDGTGALYYTFEPGDYEMVSITLEPDAYGEQPRGKVILEAPIQG